MCEFLFVEHLQSSYYYHYPMLCFDPNPKIVRSIDTQYTPIKPATPSVVTVATIAVDIRPTKTPTNEIPMILSLCYRVCGSIVYK